MLRFSFKPIVVALSAVSLSKSPFVVCDGTKPPSDLRVANAARISSAVYNSSKNLDEFHTVHIKNEIPAHCRSAHWAMYVTSKLERTAEEDKTIYLAFRGSDSTIDWLINSSFVPMKHPTYPDIKIHPGYYVEIDSDYDDLIYELKDKIRKNKIESIVVTGHSKGGAMSHVFIDRLLNDKNVDQSIKNNIQAVTFAAPMVYWFHDATKAKSILGNDRIHNYVIKQDPVPFSPYFLRHNPTATNALVDSAVNSAVFNVHRVMSIVIDLTAKFKNELQIVSKYTENFKPIGSTYVSDMPDGLKKTFTYNKVSHADFLKLASTTKTFSSAAHEMHNYIKVIDCSVDLFKTRLENAKKGKKEDQNLIGIAYWYGSGTPKNIQEAESWFTKSALQGYPIAFANLGVLYEEGNNFPKALEMYLRAAELGYKPSYARLGRLYRSMALSPSEHNLTDSVSKDYGEQAMWWFNKSVKEANDNYGTYFLAICFLEGSLCSQDIPKGKKLLDDAVNLGSSAAIYHLGLFHEVGRYGYEKSLEKAIQCYVQAADNGSSEAKKRLEALRSIGL